MEHRVGRRHDTDVAVRFVALPATIGSGRITNISLMGAFMETSCKLRLSSVVHIEGLHSGRGHDHKGAPKRLAATVVRRCSGGVGLKWCGAWPNWATGNRADTAPAVSAPGAERGWYRLDFID
jgi:hypothetical protein